MEMSLRRSCYKVSFTDRETEARTGAGAMKVWPEGWLRSLPENFQEGASFLSKVLILLGVGEGWWSPAFLEVLGNLPGPWARGRGAVRPPDLAGRGGQRAASLQGRGKGPDIARPRAQETWIGWGRA